ncbi:MAG: SDR family NAD(P)-dependent oxidoreductase [Alphaproteobacteria bacterium]|nr:SDR family NAD(P)-dependent oxidoreductase [Alphaproteobacteria bacterium]
MNKPADKEFYLLTGATSGMGLELAKKLRDNPKIHIIAGARSESSAKRIKAAVNPERITVFTLDLMSQRSVHKFADQVQSFLGDAKLGVIALNAGLQILTASKKTQDGVDETFAANHLGHFTLAHLLIDCLADGARIVSTASGTHDPNDKLATRFDFRGAIFKSAKSVASGDLGLEGSEIQLGMDRYATSKLCNILFTREMAKRTKELGKNVKFIAFDPGLMPGTHLARDRPAIVKFVWYNILPKLQPILAYRGVGISLPHKSAESLRKLLTGEFITKTGDYIEFSMALAPVSIDAQSDEYAKDLYDVSAKLAGVTLK